MSDFARLKRTLEKLRTAEPRQDGLRILAGSDANRRLAALVRELDETILPAAVELRAGADRFRFAVVNRRLQSVLELPQIAAAEVSEATKRPIEGRGDPVLAPLRKVLIAALDGEGPFLLGSERLSSGSMPGGGPDTGVRVEALAEAWEIDEGATQGGPDALAAFLDRVGGKLDGWLLIEGEEVVESGGDEASVDWIGERAGGFLDGLNSQEAALGDARPRLMGFESADGQAAIYFENGSRAGFALLPGDRLADVVACWRETAGAGS